MKRRAFFKLLGTVAAYVSAPSLLADTKPATFKLKRPKPFSLQGHGKIREVVAYSIEHDQYICRYDVLCSEEQFHVDSRFEPKAFESVEKWLEHTRPIAVEVLRDHVQHMGCSFAECKSLELPVGVLRARYL